MSWQGNAGLWKAYRRARRSCYDFVQRGSGGKLRVYYGVTDDGIHGEWRQFVKEK